MHDPIDIFQEKRFLGDLGPRIAAVAGAVGVAGVAAGVVLGLMAGDGGRTFYFAWLLNFAFYLSVVLGALFFVMLQHLTKAGWSVVVRRLGEVAADTMPVLALLFVPVAFGIHELFHWSHTEAVAHDALLQLKAPYLNMPFFIGRWVVYLLVWIVLGRFYFTRSLAQDGSGDPKLSAAMERWAPVGTLAFAFTVTFASFDLIMSLDPHWYSTIFGVYYFSGGVVAFFAVLALVVPGLQRSGLLRQAVTVEHVHDIGKLLFAFIVFWAYIAFSQYMLIWYGNIPEETEWLLRRQTAGWGWFGLVLIFGHFLLPFVVLLGRGVKRRPPLLAAVAAWMLVMHWIDLVWLIKPEAAGVGFVTPADILLCVGLGGLLLAVAAVKMRRRSLVPERDPRLDESLGFENA